MRYHRSNRLLTKNLVEVAPSLIETWVMPRLILIITQGYKGTATALYSPVRCKINVPISLRQTGTKAKRTKERIVWHLVIRLFLLHQAAARWNECHCIWKTTCRLLAFISPAKETVPEEEENPATARVVKAIHSMAKGSTLTLSPWVQARAKRSDLKAQMPTPTASSMSASLALRSMWNRATTVESGQAPATWAYPWHSANRNEEWENRQLSRRSSLKSRRFWRS